MNTFQAIDPVNNASGTPRFEVGGQAVLEGVMMRSRTGYSVAVRLGDGTIAIRQVPHRPLSRRSRLLGLPVVRGVASLVDMMMVGTRSLLWSAEVLDEDDRRRGVAAGVQSPPPTFAAAMAAAALGALALLVVGPNLLASAIGPLLFDAWAAGRGTLGFAEENHPVAFNLLAGVLRFAGFLVYVLGLTLIPEVRRVFAYHGAEHQIVSDYEAGGEPSVERARFRSPLHARCGTTHLVLVGALAIVGFGAISVAVVSWVPGYPGWPWPVRKAATLLLHALAAPLLAGVSFEILRAASRHPGARWARAATAPGEWLQRLTTRRADDAQLETALAALEGALAIAPAQRDARTVMVRGLHLDPVSRTAAPNAAGLEPAP